MRKSNHTSMPVHPLSLMHRPSIVHGMTTARLTAVPLCTYISRPSRLIHVRGARVITLSLCTGRRLTSVAINQLSILFLCRIYPLRFGFTDPPDVAPNYPDSDPLGKNTSGTPLAAMHNFEWLLNIG